MTCRAAEIERAANRRWIFVIAGAALVAGGIVLLSRLGTSGPDGQDPIAEAQNMLSRAQSKVSEIEAGLQSARQPQPA